MESTISRFQKINWPVNGANIVQTSRAIAPDTDPLETDYGDFNLGLHVGDQETEVVENRKKLNQVIGANKSIQWLNQVHGTDVGVIVEASTLPITADAAVTRSPNVALAIMTADCLPIILANHNGNEIAAIHAGWRPLANGIIQNTLAKLESDSETLVAWLGPCISQQNFQVGSEVREVFKALDPSLTEFFVEDDEKKFKADLRAIAIFLLTKLGVNQIFELADCTYDRVDKYYSYRRCNISGRMCSIITMD